MGDETPEQARERREAAASDVSDWHGDRLTVPVVQAADLMEAEAIIAKAEGAKQERARLCEYIDGSMADELEKMEPHDADYWRGHNAALLYIKAWAGARTQGDSDGD